MWETLGRCGERHFGKSFLRKCREIYGTRWNDGKGRKLFEEQGVMRAAAGDDELVDPVIGQERRVERVGSVCCGGRSGGVNEVVRCSPITSPEDEKLFDKGRTEVYPPRGFGREDFGAAYVRKLLVLGRRYRARPNDLI